MPSDRGEEVHYKFKALQISLAFHALVILIIIFADMNSSPVRPNKLIVIDFTMKNSVDTKAGTSDSSKFNPVHEVFVRGHKEEVRNQKAEVIEKDSEIEKLELNTVSYLAPHIQHASIGETQVPVLAHSTQTQEPKDEGHSFVALVTAASSLRDEGDRGGIVLDSKVTSAGSSGSSYDRGKARYLKENFLYIRDMVQKKATYPEMARLKGWEGKVAVSFIISSDGRIKDVKVMQSSGIEVLDRSATETVRNASPFPKPSAEAQIIIPIVYRLN